MYFLIGPLTKREYTFKLKAVVDLCRPVLNASLQTASAKIALFARSAVFERGGPLFGKHPVRNERRQSFAESNFVIHMDFKTVMDLSQVAGRFS